MPETLDPGRLAGGRGVLGWLGEQLFRDESLSASFGLFRDGRVPTLAEQAKPPFLDVRETANVTPADVVAFLATLDDGYN